MTRKFSGSRLKQAMESLTVEEAAVAVGVSSATVWRWRSDASEPDASQLAALSDLTGQPLDFFFVSPSEAARA